MHACLPAPQLSPWPFHTWQARGHSHLLPFPQAQGACYTQPCLRCIRPFNSRCSDPRFYTPTRVVTPKPPHPCRAPPPHFQRYYYLLLV